VKINRTILHRWLACFTEIRVFLPRVAVFI